MDYDQILLEIIRSATIEDLLEIPGVRDLITKYYQDSANQRIKELQNPNPDLEQAKQEWITEYVRVNPDQEINDCEQVAPGMYFLSHEEYSWVSFLYFVNGEPHHAYRLDQIENPHREIYTRWARGKGYELRTGEIGNITYIE
ncbi:hypothetical protein ACQ4M3_08065 [Leptolyngbya sp. AN03gr2]|uniref:hypothetical protein n=1 Tax=unclassified Leptolyngbya TaxID=2650499 RepID=UPI003D321718